jgi:hypothetical protein
MLGGTLTCSRIQIDMLGFIVGDSDIDGKDPLWDSDIVGRIRLGRARGHTDLHLLGFTDEDSDI